MRRAILVALAALSLASSGGEAAPAAKHSSCPAWAIQQRWVASENNFDALGVGCDWSPAGGWVDARGSCAADARKMYATVRQVNPSAMRAKGCVRFEDGAWGSR